MKAISDYKIIISISALFLMLILAGTVKGDDKMEAENIKTVLKSYEKSLNAGNVDEIIMLYSDEGVFMPQHSAPQVGKEAVRNAYEQLFNMIDLDIVFEIDEVVKINEGWAFARTRSKGTTTILANGVKVPEGNQELFIMKKDEGGNWKIARYIFSTTNPRQ